MRKTRLLSIGYEGRTAAELVGILTQHGIAKLLDIRALPLSRRPGFSKSALAACLKRVGIEYRHLRPAGNPHRKAKRHMEQCLQLYRGYLGRNPQVIELVTSELLGSAVAFLCYERQHDHCHRSVLLEALVQQGNSFELIAVD